MKRFAALVLAAVAVALLASPASADEQIPSGSPWGGSMVNRPAPVTSPIVELTVTGRIQNNAGTPSAVTYVPPDVTVTFSDDPEEGCVAEPDGPATQATLGQPSFDRTVAPTWKRYPYTADVPFSPQRNGDYALRVCINGVPRLDTVAQVRLPAPAVTNLVATASGHDVNLTWDDVRALAPDLAGYRIERSFDGGTFESAATIGPESATYTDTTLPASGGDVTYRVVALRPQVGDGPASNTATASYAAAPAGSDTSGTGGGTGGGSGGTGGTGTSGGGSGGAVAGRSGSATRPARSSGPAISVPRVGTPSRNFFPALLAPPVDTGFSEELPYDLGDEDDELAGEELGSDPVESLPGRGLVFPIATGLVLAVWALHLRFLARAARPEYEKGIEILS